MEHIFLGVTWDVGTLYVFHIVLPYRQAIMHQMFHIILYLGRQRAVLLMVVRCQFDPSAGATSSNYSLEFSTLKRPLLSALDIFQF